MFAAIVTQTTGRGVRAFFGLCWLGVIANPVAYFVWTAITAAHEIWPAAPGLSYPQCLSFCTGLAGMLALLRLAWQATSDSDLTVPRTGRQPV